MANSAPQAMAETTGQVAASPAHGLHHHGAAVGGGRVLEAVDGIDNVVEGGVNPQGHVGVGDVVIDGGRDADSRDASLPEGQSTFQGAFAADDDNPVDAQTLKIFHGQFLSGLAHHGLTAGAVEDGAAFLENPADGAGVHDHVLAVNEALVAFLDADNLHVFRQSLAYHGPDAGIHSR